MKQALVRVLIFFYRIVRHTGLLNTALGRKLFEASYSVYKARLEAGPVHLLRQWVRPKTVVLDVGANIGYFTVQFAEWVADGGKVIALEPEALNFGRLQKAIARAGVASQVETIQAAVADTPGQGKLELNPDHPGDHKLGAEGVPVTLTTIDTLLAERNWPEVSFIKIDVQGAEAKVLAGAAQTLERFRPAIFIEVDDKYLTRFGSSAKEILTLLTGRGYAIHRVAGDGITPPLQLDEALAIVAAKYYGEDFLLLPAAAAASPSPQGERGVSTS